MDDHPKAYTTPRCGDHVLHHPSGQTWVVAFADEDRGELSAAGWPASIVKLSDCELVMRCSDAEHTAAVLGWMTSGGTGGDFRRARVLALYMGALADPAAAQMLERHAALKPSSPPMQQHDKNGGWGSPPRDVGGIVTKPSSFGGWPPLVVWIALGLVGAVIGYVMGKLT